MRYAKNHHNQKYLSLDCTLNIYCLISKKIYGEIKLISEQEYGRALDAVDKTIREMTTSVESAKSSDVTPAEIVKILEHALLLVKYERSVFVLDREASN